MKIRPMRWWDIESVVAIEQQAFADAWTTEQFWSELAQPTRTYLVVEEEGILGYGGIFMLAPDSDIQTIAVSPDHQSRGIGALLLDELIAIASDHECTSMLLEVRSDNAAALGLYQSRDFQPISRRSNYYAPGIDAIVMRKRPLGGKT